MPAEIKISDSNYQKLLAAKEETGYQSIDEVLEDILDFWFTFIELTKRRNKSYER